METLLIDLFVDHFIIHENVKSLYITSETIIELYINYISIKNKYKKTLN